MYKFYILIILLFTLSGNSFAKVEFPSIMSNNMVLQQNSKPNLWGTAKASAKLTVITSWDNKKYTTTSNADGSWKLTVVTPKAGGPYQITFDDGEKTVLDNILIGEVWVCSGQSNMVMKMEGYNNQPVSNVNEVLLESNNNQIRLFTVKIATSTKPKNDCEGSWKVSNPQNALEFSAVAYQYGQILQKYLKVPVGLVVTAVGGTPIKAWMSAESLKEIPEISMKLPEVLTTQYPTVLYNAMIAPITNFTARGFLWYQGENDRNIPEIYEKEMNVMVSSWRSLWNQPDMPFYYVQIAPWIYDNKVSSAYLREAQLKASHSITNVGMVVTTDIGSNLTIHPPDKTTLAKRLSYIALAKTYSTTGMPYLGPEFKKMTISGKKAVLTFNNAELGLVLKDRTSQNFEIAGADRKFYPAKATITSKTLTVESVEVENPMAVRYGFKNYFDGDLYGTNGLPASSFRTDDWPRE